MIRHNPAPLSGFPHTASSFGRFLGLLLLAAFLASPAVAKDKAEAILAGTVVSHPEGEKLEDVKVLVLDEAGATVGEDVTNRKGEFEIELPAGPFLVRFTAEGYAIYEGQVELESGMKQELEAKLLDEAAGRRNKAIDAYNAGAAAHRERDFATALAHFEEAVAADPSLAPPYLALTDIHLQQGDAEAAVVAIEKYNELEPEDVQGKKLAYEAYRRAGMTDKAKAMNEQLGDQDMSKDLAVGVYNEGAIASQNGDYETALAKFQEAARLDPELAQANAGVAAILYNQEKLDEALAAADAALAIEPQNQQALRIRFLVYDGRGDFTNSMPAWEAYKAIDEAGAVNLLYTRADMEFQAGELDAARAALARVLEADPDHPRAHYTLGLTYSGTDPAKAKEHLQKFLELAPDDPEAATAKEILSYL